MTGHAEKVKAREKICWKCGEKFADSLELCPADGSRLLNLSADDVDDPMIGTLFDGRFRILKKLGEGGMGNVYAARQMDFQRDVALKLLKADYLRDENIRRRFMYEARAISGLKHPNALRLYDFGQAPPQAFYMVMELLEGESLADRLAYRFLTYREIFSIVPPVCGVLGEAHANEVVHRDLKPENIFISLVNGQEFPKLLDFGIAKHLTDETMTKSGTLWGTPAYMSPEQAKGDRVDGAADVYAIGIILYELISGNLPFHATTQMGLAVKHISVPARSLLSIPGLRSVPVELDDLIMSALSKDPAQRPASMEEFANTLERIKATCFSPEVFDSVPAEEVDAIALQGWLADEPAVEEDLPRLDAPSRSSEQLPVDTSETFARNNTGNMKVPTFAHRPQSQLGETQYLDTTRQSQSRGVIRYAIGLTIGALLAVGGALAYATLVRPEAPVELASQPAQAVIEVAPVDFDPVTRAAGDGASHASQTAFTARMVSTAMTPKNQMIFVDGMESVQEKKTRVIRRPFKTSQPSDVPVKKAIEKTF